MRSSLKAAVAVAVAVAFAPLAVSPANASERERQRPIGKIQLPKTITAPGYTTIVPKTIRTNAGQFVYVEVICRKVSASSPAPVCHTHTDGAGKVELHVSTSGPLRAVVRLTAPQVPGYTAWSSRTEIVRR